jgi:hypothetical protein
MTTNYFFSSVDINSTMVLFIAISLAACLVFQQDDNDTIIFSSSSFEEDLILKNLVSSKLKLNKVLNLISQHVTDPTMKVELSHYMDELSSLSSSSIETSKALILKLDVLHKEVESCYSKLLIKVEDGTSIIRSPDGEFLDIRNTTDVSSDVFRILETINTHLTHLNEFNTSVINLVSQTTYNDFIWEICQKISLEIKFLMNIVITELTEHFIALFQYLSTIPLHSFTGFSIIAVLAYFFANPPIQTFVYRILKGRIPFLLGKSTLLSFLYSMLVKEFEKNGAILQFFIKFFN